MMELLPRTMMLTDNCSVSKSIKGLRKNVNTKVDRMPLGSYIKKFDINSGFVYIISIIANAIYKLPADQH